jgi:tetratricopeptide (TPR) repeat protein
MYEPQGRIQFSAIALALVLSTTGLAQQPKKVDVSLEFLTELNIVEIALDTDSLVDWVKPVLNALESQFQNEPARRTIVVQVTLHPDRQADVLVAGKPALTAAERASVLKVADAARSPRSRVVDCSFRIRAKTGGGYADEKAPLEPPIETPDEHRFALFRAAGTAEKLAIMRRWARTEALPVLGATAARADAKFEGVRRLGKAIADLKPDAPIDVAALTDRNPTYWRAMIEMTPGNPLVPAARVALLTANGEIDQAVRYAEMSTFFDSGKSGYSRLLGEFKIMSRDYSQDLEARVKKGIALHDKARYQEALEMYNGVLKDAPGSAWARYEQFHTLRTLALERGNGVAPPVTSWALTREKILACDPLYQTMAEASGAIEMYQLVRRMQIGELFKKDGKAADDIVEYADIALDLEVYGFAGMLYWNAVSMTKRDENGVSDLVESFLYCLEQLGVKDLKENFNGDHAALFARIKARHQKLMEENPAFKAGAKPAKK